MCLSSAIPQDHFAWRENLILANYMGINPIKNSILCNKIERDDGISDKLVISNLDFISLSNRLIISKCINSRSPI